MEATQVPTNRQVDKKAVVRKYNGILLGHKKELAFVTAWVALSEISQSENEEYHVISLICGT